MAVVNTTVGTQAHITATPVTVLGINTSNTAAPTAAFVNLTSATSSSFLWLRFATVGTIVTNNRFSAYYKTTAVNDDVPVKLVAGLNTITCKTANSLPIVVQVFAAL